MKTKYVTPNYYQVTVSDMPSDNIYAYTSGLAVEAFLLKNKLDGCEKAVVTMIKNGKKWEYNDVKVTSVKLEGRQGFDFNFTYGSKKYAVNAIDNN